MSDETVVLESPEVDAGEITEAPEVDSGTQQDGTDGKPKLEQPDKQDGRRQPDALRKRIADLRRQADSITDPIAKEALLKDAKALNDSLGKVRAYEEQFRTVREVKEVKALLDSVGGREGLTQMQSVLTYAQQIDAQLAAGDASVIDKMWEEAPEGMPKLVPHIADRLQKENPQEYTKFLAPRAIGYLDQSGFPQAFDQMTKLYEAGKTDEAKALREELVKWVVGQRQNAQQQPKTNPEVERLQRELQELKQGGEAQKVDTAYNAVVDHAGQSIDRVLKPMASKLGLTGEQYRLLRQDVWNHLQETRNANDTYKTIAPAKQKQGYEAWTEYAKRWTDDNADASARAMVKARYGHQLQAGTKTVQTTKPVVAASIQTGKEPAPSEIDYGPKGKIAAQKAGFKDISDMILSGQAPLKAGGIRKWR